MKRIKLISTIFSLFLAGIVFSQDSLNIGFSLGDFYVDRWQKDRDYFVESANALGARVFCEYAYGDVQKQVEQVRKLIDLGIKVIVIVPTDGTAFKDVILEAKKAGVKIISYDRLILKSDIDYYISFNNREVGREQAKYAVTDMPKGNYILLGGPIKDNNAIEFVKGQKEILLPYIEKEEIKVVHEKFLNEWSSMEAFLELQTFFESNTMDVDAVIASNDLIASGVLMAVEMFLDDKKIVLTGQDANVEAVKNIYNGKQSMTVYKPIKKLAAAAAQMGVDLLNGKEPKISGSVDNFFKEVPAVLLKPVVVDKENLESTVIKDGYYTESEIFGD